MKNRNVILFHNLLGCLLIALDQGYIVAFFLRKLDKE
jgi:hypothetical protein